MAATTAARLMRIADAIYYAAAEARLMELEREPRAVS
jgi:hypothetical protein